MAATTAAVDRELVFTRDFDAPPGVVFEAWTNPEHLVKWWGPFGFSTTIEQMEVRPGGEWRLVMRGPDGRDYHNRIVFLEVDRPRLLVYKHEPEAGSELVHQQVTVRFEALGMRTRLTMRMVFPSEVERDYVVKTYKADEGGKQTLQRLADHLLASARTDVLLNRVYDAPRKLLWKVWTDPKHVANWWGPAGFTNPVCEWDAHVGGKIFIEMRGPDGDSHPMKGQFVEVVEPERISFTAAVPGPDGSIKFEVRNTATFVEQGSNQTLVTLRARVISTTDAGLINLAGMRLGWTQSLDRLAKEVEAVCK